MHRQAAILGNTIFIVLVGLFGWRALSGVDQSWDVLAYHLPFSAERLGLLSFSNFIVPANLKSAYAGFPPAYDYFRGTLVYLSGNLAAINILNLIALIILCAFVRIALGINIGLTALGLIAIPVILTNLTTAMSDVAANCLFAAGFLSAICFFSGYDKYKGYLFLFTMIMFTIAANIKPQFMTLAGLAGALFVTGFVVRSLLARNSSEPSVNNQKLCYVVGIALLAFLFYTPMRNLVVFTNPLYPVQLKLFGYTLPGEYLPSIWIDPRYSMTWPQPIRWLLSIFEYRALDGRVLAYTPGMGDVPITAMSKNVGGSFGFYVVFLMLFLAMNYKLLCGKFDKLFLSAFAVLTVIVAFLPGSHELRYYVCWQILLVVYTLFVATHGQLSLDATKAVYAVVIASFVFVNAVTGMEFLKPRNKSDFEGLMTGLGLVPARSKLTPDQKDICLVRWGPLPFLFDNYFQHDNFNPPDRVFRIAQDEKECGQAVPLIGPY